MRTDGIKNFALNLEPFIHVDPALLLERALFVFRARGYLRTEWSSTSPTNALEPVARIRFTFEGHQPGYTNVVTSDIVRGLWAWETSISRTLARSLHRCPREESDWKCALLKNLDTYYSQQDRT